MLPYLEQIINEVSKKVGVPYDVCCRIYMSQWNFILDKISQYKLKDMTLEEFRKIRPNFNIPSLGKFCVTEEKFLNVKKALELRKKLALEKMENELKEQELQEIIENVQNKENTSDV